MKLKIQTSFNGRKASPFMANFTICLFYFISTAVLQLGEITRQRDDAEMLIPSLKAKIALLKKACREKDETMTRYMEELKEYRHGLSAMSPTKKGRIHENLQQV